MVGSGAEFGIGRIDTSTDEAHWARAAGVSEECESALGVARSPAGYLALGGPSPLTAFSSRDGVTWTRLLAASASGDCSRAVPQVGWSHGAYAAIFTASLFPPPDGQGVHELLMAPDDGVRWTPIDLGRQARLDALASGPDLVVVGRDDLGPATWTWPAP